MAKCVHVMLTVKQCEGDALTEDEWGLVFSAVQTWQLRQCWDLYPVYQCCHTVLLTEMVDGEPPQYWLVCWMLSGKGFPAVGGAVQQGWFEVGSVPLGFWGRPCFSSCQREQMAPPAVTGMHKKT